MCDRKVSAHTESGNKREIDNYLKSSETVQHKIVISRTSYLAATMSASCGVFGAIFTVSVSKKICSLCASILYVPAVMFSRRKDPSALVMTM